MKTLHSLLIIVLFSSITACAQPAKNKPKHAKQKFVAMFYNVENLYDIQNDPKTDDDEFTPQGKVPWTEERLNNKFEHIGQVISDISNPALPDIIGFAEIENLEVLKMLVASPGMKKLRYGICHYESQDERGIDVALLYNPATFGILLSEALNVELPDNDRTRDILYVKGKLNNGKVLHVFVNHWPSRREGTELSEPKRMAAAQVLRLKIDAIQQLDKSANILLLGDFNDEPSDKSITQGMKALMPVKDATAQNLYSLLYPEFTNGEGSLYYKSWDLFDQIIVSGNMISGKKGIKTSTEDAGIFKAEYLLFKQKSGESRPNRTMGEKYFGGYSDHLPVYVKFSLN